MTMKLSVLSVMLSGEVSTRLGIKDFDKNSLTVLVWTRAVLASYTEGAEMVVQQKEWCDEGMLLSW